MCLSYRLRAGGGALLLALAAMPQLAHAHDGAVTPASLWQRWNLDPMLLLSLLAASALYGYGVGRLWRRAGPGRGVRRWQVAAFAGGMLSLLVALITPLDALSAALFSAHMVQHLLLMMVAAPLLVLSDPLLPLLWALPLAARQRIGRLWKRSAPLGRLACVIERPLVVWVLHAAIFWLWHLPRLYEAALASELVHHLEHACFFAVACLFWWAIGQMGGRRLERAGAGVLFVFTTALQSGALGALLTLSPFPWYRFYEPHTAAWGLSPLDDQQLGGVIMWVPSGVLYLIVAAALFVLWLQALGRRNPARDERFT